MGDPLFGLRNSFHIGAFQTAISEASQLTGLSEAEKIERDVFVYRSYIELGSYEVRRRGLSGVRRVAATDNGLPAAGRPHHRHAATASHPSPCLLLCPKHCLTPPHACRLQLVMSEISGASPMSLQAVKALALYMKDQREAALEAAASWLTDPAAASNSTVLLVAGMLYALEENYVEALKACHTGGSLEM